MNQSSTNHNSHHHHHHNNHHHHHGYNSNNSKLLPRSSSSSSNHLPSSPPQLLQHHHQNMSSSTPSESTFLKIPRIRLKQKQSSSSSQKNSPSSPPQQQLSPTENNPKNNKFSYIENSHLVNPVMIQQQQQKILNQKRSQQHHQERAVNKRNSDHYSDGEEEEVGGGGHGEQEILEGSVAVVGGSKVLIKPKKLPNPIKESVAMQSIHRELLLNQKIGRSVLNHKTELQKALEKLATKNAVDNNEADGGSGSDATTPSSETKGPNPPSLPSLPQQHHNPHSIVPHNNKNEFQRILDARAKQIEDQKCFVDGVTKQTVIRESEFEKIHKRITTHQTTTNVQK